MTRTSRGWVALVGAGPGDPGLITVRGRRLLARAEVVVHDRLANAALLDLAPPGAERIDVGKVPGEGGQTQEAINRTIVDRAQRGLRVVRLKGGDPFVFGRGWEEREACVRAGVRCIVVPGVTSAIAVPAAAHIPVTARGIAQSVTIATARGADGEPVEYAQLAASDTITLLMGRNELRAATTALIAAGRSPQTPAAVIQNGTLPTQRVVRGTLATIADLADRAGLRAPVVVVIGAVAGLSSGAGHPLGSTSALRGRCIVVTRPASASSRVARALARRGAEVILAPLISIEYRAADPRFDPRGFEWIVLTSLHGVRGLRVQLDAAGLDARALAGAKIAAVGPRTASELARIGVRADLVPNEHRAAALVEAVSAHVKPGSRALFVGGSRARDVIEIGLRRLGADLTIAHVYDTLPVAPAPHVCTAIERGVDAILLYSPSAAQALASATLPLGDALLAAVGPTTAEAARALGLDVTIVPDEYGDRGLVAALEEAFAARGALA